MRSRLWTSAVIFLTPPIKRCMKNVIVLKVEGSRKNLKEREWVMHMCIYGISLKTSQSARGEGGRKGRR